MSTNIKCPNCNHEFPLETALNDELKESIEKEKQELRQQMTNHLKKKEEEHLRKEDEWKIQQEKREKELQQQLETTLRKRISADFENQLLLLQQTNKDNEDKLKQSRQKELEFLKKEQDLRTKEEELDLTIQKKLRSEREKLSEEIRKLEEQKVAAKETDYQLKIKELEKKNDDTIKLLEEARKKNEQGSMQMQGEVQERWLFEALKASFPFDLIEDISTGKKGADIILTIRNPLGSECGKIYFESKRTKDWSNPWIDKLKQDMRTIGADIGVIVSQALPKEIERFGEKEGIYVCNLTEATSLATVLRNAVIKVFETRKSQENKGDKMVALYDYLTSHDFVDNWSALRERFRKLKAMLQKEKENFEINWKRKEKLINLIIDGSAHITGSIQGISGQDSIDLNLLENESDGDES